MALKKKVNTNVQCCKRNKHKQSKKKEKKGERRRMEFIFSLLHSRTFARRSASSCSRCSSASASFTSRFRLSWLSYVEVRRRKWTAHRLRVRRVDDRSFLRLPRRPAPLLLLLCLRVMSDERRNELHTFWARASKSYLSSSSVSSSVSTLCVRRVSRTSGGTFTG